MPMDAAALLREYITGLNAGVRGGDFGPMLRLLANDAELVFKGIPVGPFRGRAAIAEAYQARPPDDEIDLLDVEVDGQDGATVVYAWSQRPGIPAGELRTIASEDRITRLEVDYGDDGRSPRRDA